MNTSLYTSNIKLNSARSYPTKWLEGVKALAILWIAWYHIDQLILPQNHEPFSIRTLASLGFSGVNVFLLLSGFGLAFSMTCTQIQSSKTWTELPWRNFVIRRLLRIYPLYIFSHILFFLLGASVGKYADMPLDIGFVLSITGLRVFFPNYFWYGPDAFWFIGLILQLYILFPLLFWLLLKIGNLRFIILTFVLCAFSRLMTASLEDAYIFTLGLAPNRLSEFCLGMAVGYGTATSQGFKLSFFSLSSKLFWFYSFLTIMGAGFLYWGPSSPIRTVGLDLLLCIASFTAIAVLVLLTIKFSTIYNFLILMGSISYSFYLLHSPPIRPAFVAFNALGIKNVFVFMFLYIGITALAAFVLAHLESLFFSLNSSRKHNN